MQLFLSLFSISLSAILTILHRTIGLGILKKNKK